MVYAIFAAMGLFLLVWTGFALHRYRHPTELQMLARRLEKVASEETKRQLDEVKTTVARLDYFEIPLVLVEHDRYHETTRFTFQDGTLLLLTHVNSNFLPYLYSRLALERLRVTRFRTSGPRPSLVIKTEKSEILVECGRIVVGTQTV